MYMYEQTGAGETEVALHSQVNQVKFNSAFHPCGVGKSSTSLHGLGYTWSAFTCVGWQVTLCDSIWQVTSRSSEMGFPRRAISAFIFFLPLYAKGQSRSVRSLCHPLFSAVSDTTVAVAASDIMRWKDASSVCGRGIYYSFASQSLSSSLLIRRTS